VFHAVSGRRFQSRAKIATGAVILIGGFGEELENRRGGGSCFFPSDNTLRALKDPPTATASRELLRSLGASK